MPRIAGAYGDYGITQAKRGNVDQHPRHGFLAHANALLWFVHDFDDQGRAHAPRRVAAAQEERRADGASGEPKAQAVRGHALAGGGARRRGLFMLVTVWCVVAIGDKMSRYTASTQTSKWKVNINKTNTKDKQLVVTDGTNTYTIKKRDKQLTHTERKEVKSSGECKMYKTNDVIEFHWRHGIISYVARITQLDSNQIDLITAFFERKWNAKLLTDETNKQLFLRLNSKTHVIEINNQLQIIGFKIKENGDKTLLFVGKVTKLSDPGTFTFTTTIQIDGDDLSEKDTDNNKRKVTCEELDIASLAVISLFFSQYSFEQLQQSVFKERILRF